MTPSLIYSSAFYTPRISLTSPQDRSREFTYCIKVYRIGVIGREFQKQQRNILKKCCATNIPNGTDDDIVGKALTSMPPSQKAFLKRCYVKAS